MNEVLNLKLVSFSSQNRVWHTRHSKWASVSVLFRIGTFLVKTCKTKEKYDEEEIQLTICLRNNIFIQFTNVSL